VIPRWLVAMAMPLVVAVAFWLVLPAQYRVAESTDYESFYRPVAMQLLAGNGLVTENGAPAVRYPPGYPVLVAAALGIGDLIGLPEATSLDMLMFACIAVSSLFLYLIARDMWGGWLALLPSAAWSTYPLALWLTKQPNSEVPFTMVLFASVFVMWRLLRGAKPNLWLATAAGALAGAAMLIRPIAILLPFVFAILVWRLGGVWERRQRLLTIAKIVAMSLVIVAPWEIHASHAEGKLVVLSTGGVPSMRDGLTFGVNADKSYRQGIYVPDAIRTVMISFYSEYDSLNSYGAIAHAGLRELGAHPVGVAGLIGMKLLRAWYGTDSQRLDKYIALLQLVYLFVLARAARIAWKAGGERRRLVVLVLVTVAYFWLMSALALPLVRYMVPAIGLAFLWVPVLWEKGEQRRA
jgi:4-amino-4-deoxy-L-arabinose transferase-like glycosyltransferase